MKKRVAAASRLSSRMPDDVIDHISIEPITSLYRYWLLRVSAPSSSGLCGAQANPALGDRLGRACADY
jgi:hypothetical protein